MIQLTGESLGKRQQELNKKVLEAIENQTNFDEIRTLEEASDIDKLYKIDVASHYKNIEYIVDILKCGDSLYISRALKCKWLYNDAFSHIVNPDHLHRAIFPHMSFKMKTKMLNYIAANIKNEARAEAFFEFCRKHKMKSFAPKFLVHTSDSYKKDIIENDSDYIISINLKHFIGSSFDVATSYMLKLAPYRKSGGVHQLSYLYTVDEEKYLDLFETHARPKSACQFGLRISKSIMTKHKSRVLASPLLYVHHLNKRMVARYSTSDEAKKFIIALFPAKLEDFWKHNLYPKYKRIFDIIPKNVVLEFFKSTFFMFYGNQEFEMNPKFYDYQYYEMYTAEEREKWALRHVNECKDVLGSNTDYIWYTFVNFEKAFDSIKRYILLTEEEDVKNKMFRILISSAKKETDLEQLFDYYYETRLNESGHHKVDFIDEVINKHKIIKFKEKCWHAFNKILFNMEVYSQGVEEKNKYRALCIIYNIIHGKDMHDVLTFYLDSIHTFDDFVTHRHQLGNNKEWDQVFRFLYEYFLRRFTIMVNTDDADANKQDIINIVHTFINLLETFDKPRDALPAIFVLFIQEYENDFVHLKNNELKDLKQADLLRLLKKDKALVLEKISELKNAMNRKSFVLSQFIKKIRIYFSKDLGIYFNTFFKKCIENEIDNDNPWYMLNTCVYGLFQLENENSKVQFLNSYVPTDEKIEHRNTDKRVLAIRKIICRLAGYSRPPLPISHVLQYTKGDYVSLCLPMFHMLVVNLPLPLSNKLMEGILHAPSAIQEHGFRLAFKMYRHDNLKNLMCDIWNNTKSASVRLEIYGAFVDKIIFDGEDDDLDVEITEPIKQMTSSLNSEDDDEIFDLVCSCNTFPEKLQVDLLKRAWTALTKTARKKSTNIKRKTNILNALLYCKPYNIDRKFLRSKIIDKHIKNMLCKKKIIKSYKSSTKKLHTAIWNLTVAYIIFCDNESEFLESMQVLELILQETFRNWNEGIDTKNGFIHFFYNFFGKMKHGCVYNEGSLNVYVLPLFENILKTVAAYSPRHEMFSLSLDIKLFLEILKVLNKQKGDYIQTAKYAAESLLKFIQELRANNFLLPCFFNNTSCSISNSIRDLCAYLRIDPKLMTLNICNELLLFDDMDAIMFAISILPLPSSEVNDIKFVDLRSKFAEKVKQINNFQIQSYFYNRLYLSDAIGLYQDKNLIETSSKTINRFF